MFSAPRSRLPPIFCSLAQNGGNLVHGAQGDDSLAEEWSKPLY